MDLLGTLSGLSGNDDVDRDRVCVSLLDTHDEGQCGIGARFQREYQPICGILLTAQCLEKRPRCLVDSFDGRENRYARPVLGRRGRCEAAPGVRSGEDTSELPALTD